MDEPEDLARRFLALWSDYLTAVVAEPGAVELLHRWFALGGLATRNSPEGDDDIDSPGSEAGAATAAGASRQRVDALAQLSRRVDELEARITTMEQRRRPASRARPRPRAGRDRQG